MITKDELPMPDCLYISRDPTYVDNRADALKCPSSSVVIHSSIHECHLVYKTSYNCDSAVLERLEPV